MSKEVTYELDIRFPDQSPHRETITNKLSLGSSSKCDLCIEDYNLSPLHLSFRTHNGVLSLHNLGGTNTTTLGEQVLHHGKMYILNIGDNLKAGDIEVFIREGETLTEDETPTNLKELFEEATDPNYEVETQDLINYEEAPPVDSPSEDFDHETDGQFKFQSAQDLVEDEDEEDYEEVESENKSIVQKLTNIFKAPKKDLQKEIVKNNKNISIPKVAPGFFLRFFSFISLTALSYTTVDQIFPILDIDKLINPHLLEVQKLLTEVPHAHYLSLPILKVVSVYLLLEIFTTLLFGQNIAYILLGVRNADGAISKRLKGVVRSLIGIITAPLLIFDLPSIIKKRTLKEYISGSKLHAPSRILQFLGIFVITPFLVLSPLYTPILTNLNKFKPTEVVEQRPVAFSKNEELISKEWSSANLKLNFKGNVSKKLLVFPTIKINKDVLKASIKFNSIKNLNSWTNISYLGEIDFLSNLRPLVTLNPMFSIHYPELKSELLSEKDNAILSTLAFEQLFQLLKRSINLDPLNFQDIFLNHGPFLKDIIGINTLLAENLNIQKNDSLTVFKNNDKILIGNTNRSSNTIRTKYLIISRDSVSTNFRVSTPKKYFRYTSKMVENLLQNSTAYKKRKSKEIHNWAKTLDTLTSIVETKKDLSDSELAKVYEYYFEFTRKYLAEIDNQKEKDKKIFKAPLVSEINNIIKYLDSTLEFNEFQKVSELNTSLKRLTEKFESEDLNFFLINE